MDPVLLPQIIGRSAERFPTKDAFRCEDEAITYADLEARSNQLAHSLVTYGVSPGDFVGIHMGKSTHNAVAIFGIQKAGAAYVPIDPSSPPARVNAIANDCGITHLVTDHGRVGGLQAVAELGSRVQFTFGVESGPFRSVPWDEVWDSPVRAPSMIVRPEDPAYIIYTSGSTGAPKGIVHTHASAMNYARMSSSLYELTSDDRLSNFSPMHFDMSTFDLFSGPLAGATTVMISEQRQLVPASLSQLIETERLTVWYSVPFILIQLLTYGVLPERDLSSLRWVIYGGEPFPLKHLKALMDRWPSAAFSNCYGPAEVNQCTYFHVDRLTEDDVAANRSIPIGRPCRGVRTLVVDSFDREVTAGDSGELLVDAPTAMRGYWNKPSLNTAAFHTPGDGIRYYRTGDRVRYGSDGELEFLGRMDRQVKSRGYRIELDEVEAAIATHPGVLEAAVYQSTDEVGTIRAAVMVNPGSDADTTSVRVHAAAKLPRYAVPTTIGVVDSFPRTATGKVDYRSLSEGASVT